MAPITKEQARMRHRVAIQHLRSLFEESLGGNDIPQPSAFGVVGQDREDEDPVYEWCMEFFEVLDTCEDDLLPHEEEEN